MDGSLMCHGVNTSSLSLRKQNITNLFYFLFFQDEKNNNFWKNSVYKQEGNACPYGFNVYVSKRCFNEITRYLHFMDMCPPTF
mmetsp:Transcript_19630/g.42056  ORF Transcript_19630/g.42056 Transcript_19630/m.42056 type:complete len:83 (+) Transcript_19630:1946-2194(+)